MNYACMAPFPVPVLSKYVFNSQTAKALNEELSERQIEHVEKRFRSDEGISDITTDIFVSCHKHKGKP